MFHLFLCKLAIGWNLQNEQEEKDMKRLLAATCAAAMLTASLTGCGMTNNRDPQNNSDTSNTRPSYNTSTGTNNGTGNTGTNNSTGNTGANNGAGTQNGTNGGTSNNGTNSANGSNGANNSTTANDGTGNVLTNNGVNNGTNTYADGANQDRSSYNRMLSSRARYGTNMDGKYTAYSDGNVSDKGSTGSLTQDTKNVGRSLMNGTRNIISDVNNAVHDLGGVPRADAMPRK